MNFLHCTEHGFFINQVQMMSFRLILHALENCNESFAILQLSLLIEPRYQNLDETGKLDVNEVTGNFHISE